MRLSHLFGRTLRETPAGATLPSHQLSIRAGLIDQLAAGIYSYLPLGWRVLTKIAKIARQEMNAVDGQEISMPLVQPAELWKATGRYDATDPGPALVRFQDRSGHQMVLGMTHEEVATELARRWIRADRQLPAMVYQIQTKFRDEPRARGGLVRAREFLMLDGYSFHADADDLGAYYRRAFAACEQIFARCELEVVAVEAAGGMMGGAASHEFVAINPLGEDTVVTCRNCGYAANVESAIFAKGEGVRGTEASLRRVATPGTTTIEDLAKLLRVETRQILKAVFYATRDGELIFAVIRGDLEVSEEKLSRLLGGVTVEAAPEDALRVAGLVPGYASPVGVSAVRVIGDDSIESGDNYVAGANEAGYHLLNVNYPRDYGVDAVADIALTQDGDTCAHCGGTLVTSRAIEVGHIFQLGTARAFTDAAEQADPFVIPRALQMGCYGIGLGRLIACIIEQHHDEWGIIWPPSVAPFEVHVVCLGPPGSEVGLAADALYNRLRQQGRHVLYDDRDERPGVKFNDADLIGAPVRCTVSRRTLALRAVELKARWESTRRTVPDQAVEKAIGDILATGARS